MTSSVQFCAYLQNGVIDRVHNLSTEQKEKLSKVLKKKLSRRLRKKLQICVTNEGTYVPVRSEAGVKRLEGPVTSLRRQFLETIEFNFDSFPYCSYTLSDFAKEGARKNTFSAALDQQLQESIEAAAKNDPDYCIELNIEIKKNRVIFVILETVGDQELTRTLIEESEL